MFCDRCGYEIPANARFCPNCGKLLPGETPWWDVPETKKYKEDRSAVLFVVLSILTIGIYPIYVKCQLGRDVEEICEGEPMMHYIAAFFLSMITFGVVDLIWTYHAARCAERFMAEQFGEEAMYHSDSVLISGILGYFTLGITRFLCDAFFLEDVNQLASLKNRPAAQTAVPDASQIPEVPGANKPGEKSFVG